MKRGVIIRHLVLPGLIEDCKKLLDWIYITFGENAFISLMAQYYPTFHSYKYPEIHRRLTQKEYDEITDYLFSLGFEDGLVQEMGAADEKYIPPFEPGFVG